MSANEIIAELPRLNRSELEAVDAKLHELLAPVDHMERQATPNWGENSPNLPAWSKDCQLISQSITTIISTERRNGERGFR